MADQAATTKPTRVYDLAIPPHPPGYRLRRGRNWFFLGLLYAGYYLCRYNLGIVAPELKQQFHFTNAQYGAINTGRDWGYAFGQFLNGLFTDGLGGKQATNVSLISRHRLPGSSRKSTGSARRKWRVP